ncbi:hypothetical protein TCE0_017f04381 [Talaromyces pinophilus]|uniref:Uncharacterized protein n=1 Tax=Talaromyces pinophilus TaxID=128442 RepID=A0A6V8H382_TALPI|nr:hypothetical protein TCE0_017f04381 [Talaromyces pinophilus]
MIFGRGTPSTVRLHPNDEWSEDELKEESKGWCQFVKEEWIPKTDLNEEMQQRQALIERWASADQNFRDSYHRRAPLRDSSLDYPPNLLPKYLAHQKRFICLAPVDREKHSENYKRLLKVLILLYNHENRSLDHPMAHYTNWDPCHIPAIIVDPSFTDTADDPSFSSYRNLLINYYLHPADFRAVSMTRAGTIVFPKVNLREFIVIDQESLNEGRLAVMNFKFNGQLENYALLRPIPMGKAMLHLYLEGWSVGEVLNGEESNWAARRWNKP